MALLKACSILGLLGELFYLKAFSFSGIKKRLPKLEAPE